MPLPADNIPPSPPLLRFLGALFAAIGSIVGAPTATGQDEFLPLAPVVEEYDQARHGHRELYDLVRKIREQRKIPSLFVAIVDSKDLVAQAATGVRKVGSPELVTIDDRVHLGSCTKAMTATLCGQLVEEGKLGWEGTIADSLADIKDGLHPDFAGVALEELLRHRSGVARDGDWDDLGAKRTTTEQREELARRLLSQSPTSERGDYVYSNAGYAIAGLMAERAAKKSWEELMRAKLFKPLGMATAGFGPPGTTGQVDQPWGHERKDDTFRPMQFDNPASLGPAGTAHASMADWGKFVSAHLRGLRGQDTIIGASATIAKLHEPSDDEHSYAMGWSVAPRGWAMSPTKPPDDTPRAVKQGRAHTHNGSNTKWACVVWMAPGADFAVLTATNVWGDAAMTAIDEAAAGTIGWKILQE